MKYFFTILVFFIPVLAVYSQCNCPDSVRNRFRYSAAEAVMENAYTTNDTSIINDWFVPKEKVDSILDKVCIIYNDTVNTRINKFILAGGHFLLSDFLNTGGLNQFSMTINAGISEGYKLYKTKTTTGNVKVDSLFLLCGLKLVKADSNMGFLFLEFSSDTFINSKKLNQEISFVSPYFVLGNYYGGTDHSRWNYRKHGDTQILSFNYRRGDCLSGCMISSFWNYHFTNGCHILKMNFEDKLMSSGKKNIYYDANKDVKVCSNSTPAYTYSLYTMYPYQYYTGEPFGRWYINDIPVYNNKAKTDSFGTFILKHIPYDTNGVYVYDTVRVIRDTTPGFKELFTKDSFELCCHKSNYPKELVVSKVRESIEKGLYYGLGNYNSPVLISDTVWKRETLAVRNVSNGCTYYDTAAVRCIVAGNQWQERKATIICEEDSIELSSLYPGSNYVWSNNKSATSKARYNKPGYESAEYQYKGCPVKERFEIKLRPQNYILTKSIWEIYGTDSTILDAGTGWETIFWNGLKGGRFYKIKGKEVNHTDSLILECIDSFNCKKIIIKLYDRVSSIQALREASVDVYPMPADNSLVLRNIMVGQFELFNMLGVKVLNGDFNNGIIPLTNISSGNYILLVKNNDGNIAYKQKIMILKSR